MLNCLKIKCETNWFGSGIFVVFRSCHHHLYRYSMMVVSICIGWCLYRYCTDTDCIVPALVLSGKTKHVECRHFHYLNYLRTCMFYWILMCKTEHEQCHMLMNICIIKMNCEHGQYCMPILGDITVWSWQSSCIILPAFLFQQMWEAIFRTFHLFYFLM